MKGINGQEFTGEFTEHLRLSLLLSIFKMIILQWHKLSHPGDHIFLVIIFTAHSRLEACASCDGKTMQVWLLSAASASGWSLESDGITTPFHQQQLWCTGAEVETSVAIPKYQNVSIPQ